MDSSLEVMGNDEEYEKSLFKAFENVNGKEYEPLTKDKIDYFIGRYKRGRLNYKNELPIKFEEIEFCADGKVIPDSDMSGWKHYDKNIFMTYHPYEAMPEYGVKAGIEEQAKYVFLALDNSSIIITNSDGSSREIYLKS